MLLVHLIDTNNRYYTKPLLTSQVNFYFESSVSLTHYSITKDSVVLLTEQFGSLKNMKDMCTITLNFSKLLDGLGIEETNSGSLDCDGDKIYALKGIEPTLDKPEDEQSVEDLSRLLKNVEYLTTEAIDLNESASRIAKGLLVTFTGVGNG